jgi:hypothetical protein
MGAPDIEKNTRVRVSGDGVQGSRVITSRSPAATTAAGLLLYPTIPKENTMTEEPTDTEQFRLTAVDQSHLRYEDASYGMAESFVDGAMWGREQALAPKQRLFDITPESIAADAPLVRVPMVLVERARWAMHNENLEMLDETIEDIIESAGRPHEDAEADTNALRARHHQLMLDFPDQGFDWRTPVTALVNEIPALVDEIDRLRTLRPSTIDTEAALDSLPEGAVIRGLGHHGVWQVTDGEDLKRYASAAGISYHTGKMLLELCGPFELLWTPTV